MIAASQTIVGDGYDRVRRFLDELGICRPPGQVALKPERLLCRWRWPDVNALQREHSAPDGNRLSAFLRQRLSSPHCGDQCQIWPRNSGSLFAQPGRPTREWSGRLAQTRGQDRQDYVQHGRGRPSVGETPANTVDVFLASAAPLARDSGCPPNRVNPNPGDPSGPHVLFVQSRRDPAQGGDAVDGADDE